MKHPIIAFIGAGNMASYIIKGLIATSFPAENIIAARRSQQALEQLQVNHQINITTDNVEAAEKADIIILCVKPAMVKSVLAQLSPLFKNKKPVLASIATGITVKQLSDFSNSDLSVIRVMPNLPVATGCGISSLCASSNTPDTDKQQVEKIFSAVGMTFWLEEKDYNIATMLAGSGPALFYRFIEVLVSGATACDLDLKTAQQMALHTGLGAYEMLRQMKEDPAVLRGHITSPGGTTQAALEVLEKHNFEALVKEALDAGVHRAEVLSADQ
ncbi:MAG: pyrroline-5-carboxylate reductase [Endozoicomonadaceae bacterium]|nr:pyrroline-5-carboxylate reductase [Endozoicomonadaceae bacterium]